MNILALDVGTSSVKAAVLEQSAGLPLGPVVQHSYALEQPEPDAVVIDAEKLRTAVFAAGREAAQGFWVDGIGLSCLSPSLILLDKKGKPLTPIITHLDRRARAEARQINAEVGAEFLTENGNRPLPGGISAVVFRHLCKQEPKLRQHVRRFLHLNGWLGMLLTDRPSFDPANGCFSGLCASMQGYTWSPRWCGYFGVEEAWLPPVQDGKAELGLLSTPAAKQLGVIDGHIRVRLGTADTSSALLATGLEEGEVLHVVGTTQVLATLTSKPQPDARRLTRPFGVGNSFLHVTHNPVGGVALDWLHQLCFREQTADDFYRTTIPQAQRRVSPVKLEPPFLGGDRLEIEARFAHWTGLSLTTDRLDLLASVLEGMKEGHRQAWANLGLTEKPSRIVLTGGGAEVIAKLLPEYEHVERIEQASLRGVARLFD
jgi:xylulokinase